MRVGGGLYMCVCQEKRARKRGERERVRESSFEADAEIRTENSHLFILLYSKLPSDSCGCTHVHARTHSMKKIFLMKCNE